MAKRRRRKVTAEFQEETVRLCRLGDRTLNQVAKDLGLTESAVRTWVGRAEAEASKAAPAGALAAAERSELQELRRRVKRLEMEREILKKAAAFFAKENG